MLEYPEGCRIHAKSIAACVVAVAVCFLIASANAAEPRPLGDVIENIHDVWDQLEGRSEEQHAHRQLWIDRLELAMAQSDDPVLQASAMPILGTLLERNNELNAAEAVYSKLAANTNASISNRLMASVSASGLAVTLGLEERALSHWDSFEALYDGAKDDQDVVAGFAVERSLVNARRASACRVIGFKHAASLAASGDLSAATEAECVGLQKSMVFLKRHLETFDTMPPAEDIVERMKAMNWGREGTFLQYAATAIEAANRMDGEDGEAVRKDLYGQARDSLKAMLESFPAGRMSVSAGPLFVEAISQTAMNPTEEIEAAQWWTERARPGHGVLSALRERAVVLQASSQTECVEGSSGLFRIVMKAEKQWYPGDYLHHTNYQWAIVAEAQNMLYFSDVAEAVALLDELKSTELRGSFIKRSVESLTRSINNYYAPVDQMRDQAVGDLPEGGAAMAQGGHSSGELSEEASRQLSSTGPSSRHSRDTDASGHKSLYIRAAICVGAVVVIVGLGVLYARYRRAGRSE